MLKQSLISAALLAMLVAVAGTAQAQSTVVNTGAPGTSDINGFSLDSNDWIDGQISLSGKQTITSIKSFLDNPFGGAGDNFNITLYTSNANNTIGTLLYTGTASYSGSTGWNGLSNLNWAVNGGNYWVGLEVTDAQSTQFVATTGAPTLLANTAFSANGGSNYSYRTLSGTGLSKDMNFGLQVASVSAVPEVSEWLMLLVGLGLVGFCAARRSASGNTI